MSLDVYLERLQMSRVYEGNITHNLGLMAKAAGVYRALWRPEEIGITKAEQLIPILAKGLKKLKKNPSRFRRHNPANGWGTYEDLVVFVGRYLAACKENPKARVRAWR